MARAFQDDGIVCAWPEFVEDRNITTSETGDEWPLRPIAAQDPRSGMSGISEADPPSQPDRHPRPPKGLAVRSSYKERCRERRERGLTEGKEAIAREVAER
jgi:hypothetical protein